MSQQQVQQVAQEMKDMIKKMIKMAFALEMDQADMFDILRDKVAETFTLAPVTAANLVRVCVNEVVFELTGQHHYTAEQMAIICERGKSGK